MLKKIVSSSLRQKRMLAITAFCALSIASTAWFSHSLTAPLGKKLPSSMNYHARATHAIAMHPDTSLLFPPALWPQKKFIALTKPKLFQKFGYELYLTKNLSASTTPLDSALETSKRHLRYDILAGKILTVQTVDKVGDEYLVSFTDAVNGKTYFAETHKLAIEGIAYVEDLDKAAKQWIGKTVFSRRRFLDIYDTAKGSFGTYRVDIQQKLKVTSVQWGTTPMPPRPIWLCVKTDGPNPICGIIPISQTFANVMTDKMTSLKPWDDDIFENNPMDIYTWDSLTWKAINTHTIVSGMTKEQVRVSWGSPHRIISDTTKPDCAEQWIYGSQYLCFKSDSVTSVGAQ